MLEAGGKAPCGPCLKLEMGSGMAISTPSDLPRLDGPTNMRLDAWLLHEAETESRVGWRVYGWDGPWVSLGKHQDPERDLRDPRIVPWVMRPTGGKGVLHGHDVTVAIGAPLELCSRSSALGADPTGEGSGEAPWGSFRSVRDVYRFMTAPIVVALRECGLPAVLAESGRGARKPTREHGEATSPDCFGSVSPNDVVHERLGMKVCGCALRVVKGAALLQASIPAGPPLIDPRRVFDKPALSPVMPWDAAGFASSFDRAMRAAVERWRSGA